MKMKGIRWEFNSPYEEEKEMNVIIQFSLSLFFWCLFNKHDEIIASMSTNINSITTSIFNKSSTDEDQILEDRFIEIHHITFERVKRDAYWSHHSDDLLPLHHHRRRPYDCLSDVFVVCYWWMFVVSSWK